MDAIEELNNYSNFLDKENDKKNREIENNKKIRVQKIIKEIKNKSLVIEIYNNKILENLETMNEKVKSIVLPTKNEIEKETGVHMDTHVISKNSEYALINNKLKDIYKSKIQYELIYRASVDGAFGKIFKKKCLKVRRTLIVVESKKNKIFGGFTEARWNDSDSDYKDENAFCFSLNENKIYNSIKDTKAISCLRDFGPIFCDMFEITDNFASDGGFSKCLDLEMTKYDGVTKDYELPGEEIFDIKELEVFKVKIE